MRYQRNETNKEKISQLCFDVLYFILICSSIINRNEYASGYAFVIVPVTLFVIYVFYDSYRISIHSYHYIAAVLCVFYVISTLFSDTQTQYIESAAIASVLSALLYLGWTGKKYNKYEINKMLHLYVIVAVGFAFIILYNVYTGNLDEYGRSSIIVFGTVKDANYLAAFLCPAMPYCLAKALNNKRMKIINLSFWGIIAIAVYMTGSRGGFMTALVSSLLIAIDYMIRGGASANKIFFMILLFIAILGIYVYLQSTALFVRMMNIESYTDDIRLKLWSEALRAFTKNPIFGSGRNAGSFYSYMRYRKVQHSTIIEIISDEGIIGTVTFVALLFQIIKVKKNNLLFMSSMMIGFLLPMAFVNAYQTLSLWINLSLLTVLSMFLKEHDIKWLLENDNEELNKNMNGGTYGKYIRQ